MATLISSNAPLAVPYDEPESPSEIEDGPAAALVCSTSTYSQILDRHYQPLAVVGSGDIGQAYEPSPNMLVASELRNCEIEFRAVQINHLADIDYSTETDAVVAALWYAGEMVQSNHNPSEDTQVFPAPPPRLDLIGFEKAERVRYTSCESIQKLLFNKRLNALKLNSQLTTGQSRHIRETTDDQRKLWKLTALDESTEELTFQNMLMKVIVPMDQTEEDKATTAKEFNSTLFGNVAKDHPWVRVALAGNGKPAGWGCIICADKIVGGARKSASFSSVVNNKCLENMTKHVGFKAHINAVLILNSATRPQHTQVSITSSFAAAKATPHSQDRREIVQAIANKLAVNNRPLSSAKELVQDVFQIKGTEKNIPDSREFYLKVIKFQSEVYTSGVLNLAVGNDRGFSVLIDESTAIDNTRCLVIVLRCLFAEDKARDFPFDYAAIDGDASAETLGNLLVNRLLAKGFTKVMLKSKLLAIHTDNARVMTGRSALCQVVKQLIDRDSVVILTCKAHTLDLTIKTIGRRNPAVEEFIKLYTDLHDLYKTPKAFNNLENLAKKLQLPEPRVLRPIFTIRWSMSIHEMLGVLTHNWLVIIFDLHIRIIQAGTGKARAAPATVHVLALRSYQFARNLGILKDVLKYFGESSLKLQKSCADIASACSVLSALSFKLRSMAEGEKGPAQIRVDEMITNGYIAKLHSDQIPDLDGIWDLEEQNSLAILDVKVFCTNLADDIDSRLSDEKRTVNSTLALSISKFAVDELSAAISARRDSGGDFFTEEEILGKIEIASDIMLNIEPMHPFIQAVGAEIREAMELLTPRNSWDSNLPSLARFAAQLKIFAASTAECERAFSALNLIKTKNRSNLTSENACALMIVKLYSPGTTNFGPFATAFANRWDVSGKGEISGRKRKHSESKKDYDVLVDSDLAVAFAGLGACLKDAKLM